MNNDNNEKNSDAVWADGYNFGKKKQFEKDLSVSCRVWGMKNCSGKMPEGGWHCCNGYNFGRCLTCYATEDLRNELNKEYENETK